MRKYDVLLDYMRNRTRRSARLNACVDMSRWSRVPRRHFIIKISTASGSRMVSLTSNCGPDSIRLLIMTHSDAEAEETQPQIGVGAGGTREEMYVRDETFYDDAVVFNVSVNPLNLCESYGTLQHATGRAHKFSCVEDPPMSWLGGIHDHAIPSPRRRYRKSLQGRRV